MAPRCSRFASLATILIFAGCGGSTQLDQNSTCKQFMAAKPSVRLGVVSRLYSATHDGATAAPSVLTQTESVCRTKPGTNLINVPGLTFDAPSAPASASSNQEQSSNQAPASAPPPPKLTITTRYGSTLRVSLQSITMSKTEVRQPYLFPHVNMVIANASDRTADITGVSDMMSAAVRPSAAKGCTPGDSEVPGWCHYDVVLNNPGSYTVPVGQALARTMYLEGDTENFAPNTTSSDIRIFIGHRELVP